MTSLLCYGNKQDTDELMFCSVETSDTFLKAFSFLNLSFLFKSIYAYIIIS